MLSSTKIGEKLGISANKVNLILAELGWIEKRVKGWVATERGQALGGKVREVRNKGVPFVVWPAQTVSNPVLLDSVKEFVGDGPQQEYPAGPGTGPVASKKADSFRERFEATHRSADGHMVRSRAEMLIDNWLYMQGIVHAVERKLPIEEEAYCDFYLPSGKVYIEYWGLENQPTYAKRKAEKQVLYAHYKLNLVEIADTEIKNIDDILPARLLRYNIDCT